MSLKNILFVTLSLFIVSFSSAQRNYDQFNHLGILGGVTLLNIDTPNFDTQQGEGFMIGFTTRGAVYNQFDLIYGVSFLQTEIGIRGRDITGQSNNGQSRYIQYKMQSAQINFLGSMNIIRKHLSLEFGPVLNVNGKMKLKNSEFSEYTINGYTDLKADEIQNVSRVHFYAAGGITAGLENFRLMAQYQYGVTNFFGRLNDLEIEQDEQTYEGKTGTWILAGIIYF